MGKSEKQTSHAETSSRSPERLALAEAIRVRDEAAADAETFVRARERAAADRFLAARAVEKAESTLIAAREAARESLVGAYIDDEIFDDSAVTKSEAELRLAQRHLNDLQIVADELAAHKQAPGHSVPATNVTKAVRAVVQAHPTVRRLVADFDTARRTFQTYHSTLRWLAAHNCIPADLLAEAPKAHETFYAEPAVEWVQALEALNLDADATLPE